MKRENKNFVLNLAYQLLLLAFPLITTPYISRVLGVDNIGIYSYTYSIVNMFMLFAMLGILNHGNRSIAQSRNSEERSKTFSAIYTLQLLCCGVSLIGYLVYVFNFSNAYSEIFLLQVPFLISVCFDISWLFFGMEQFMFPLSRNLIIKILSLALIVALVKKANDLWVYTLIMSGATFLSNTLLIFAAPKFVRYHFPSKAEIKPHIKPVLILFVPVLAFSLYNIIDKTMLGAIASVTELGYYENSQKINSIPTAIITALGTVMLPRMSNLVSNNRANFKEMIASSMKLALILATTMCFGLLLIGNDAALVLFGESFQKSGILIQLLAITIIANAWSNVIRTQYLIPLKHDLIYVYSTFGAGIINFVMNLVLIPRFGSIGACFGTIAAEYFIAIFQTVATFTQLENMRYLKTLLIGLSKAAVIFVISYVATFQIDNLIWRFSVKILLFLSLFIVCYFRYIKNDFLGINRSSSMKKDSKS